MTFSVSLAGPSDFTVLVHSLSSKATPKRGAGREPPIFQSSTSTRKNPKSLSVCWLSHSMAWRCSSRACATIPDGDLERASSA